MADFSINVWQTVVMRPVGRKVGKERNDVKAPLLFAVYFKVPLLFVFVCLGAVTTCILAKV